MLNRTEQNQLLIWRGIKVIPCSKELFVLRNFQRNCSVSYLTSFQGIIHPLSFTIIIIR